MELEIWYTPGINQHFMGRNFIIDMNTIRLVILIILGLIAIWFGWRVFMTSSMVRSAYSLLATMTVLGIMFLVMQAEFLAVLQIMMMATAQVFFLCSGPLFGPSFLGFLYFVIF